MQKCTHCINDAKWVVVLGWYEMPFCFIHYLEFRRRKLKERGVI